MNNSVNGKYLTVPAVHNVAVPKNEKSQNKEQKEQDVEKLKMAFKIIAAVGTLCVLYYVVRSPEKIFFAGQESPKVEATAATTTDQGTTFAISETVSHWFSNQTARVNDFMIDLITLRGL